MQYIIDIILVVLFGFIVYRAAKKGFFMTLFELGAYVISLICSKMASSALAPVLYSNMFEKPLTDSVSNSLGSAGQTDISAKITDAVSSIPTQLDGVLDLIGINRQQLIDSVQSSDIAGKTPVDSIMEKIISPVSTAIIQTILFILLSVIISFVLRLVIRFMNKTIKKIPAIKQVNSSLGAVIGIVKALIVVIIIALALGALSGVFNNEEIVELVNNSIIVKSTGRMLDSISGYKF